MTTSLNEKKSDLISHIMVAKSQVEVEQCITAAVYALQQNIGNEAVLASFVDNLADELYSFNPYKENAIQWSNIKMARIIINRIKYHWHTSIAV
jgi:hypothetical protein